MAVDIGSQIVILIIFGFMALLTKKNYPEIAKIFGMAILVLVFLFGLIDILDVKSLLPF